MKHTHSWFHLGPRDVVYTFPKHMLGASASEKSWSWLQIDRREDKTTWKILEQNGRFTTYGKTSGIWRCLFSIRNKGIAWIKCPQRPISISVILQLSKYLTEISIYATQRTLKRKSLATFLIIVPNWKQLTCPFTGEWVYSSSRILHSNTVLVKPTTYCWVQEARYTRAQTTDLI